MISTICLRKLSGSIIDSQERGTIVPLRFMENTSRVLSEEEWCELCSLKTAIDESPATVVASKMERFTELFVRTLHGKGDTMREASL